MKLPSLFRILKITFVFALSIHSHTINAQGNYNSKSSNVKKETKSNFDLSSFEFSKKFGRGWNLGNSLEAIGGETAWGNPLTTQRLIDSVKAAGFNSIRIPVAWSKFTDEFSYTIKDSWLERVEEVVNYAINNEMYVILNEHWDGGWLQPTNAANAKAGERLAAIWDQVAFYFRDYDEHLIFAGTNEVMVDGNYGTPTKEYYTVQNGYNQLFVNTVRATGGNNANRYLAVQGYNTNIEHTLSFFNMPSDDAENKLIVEVHYYDPFDFTINTGSTLYVWGNNAKGSQAWANEAHVNDQFNRLKSRFIDKNIAVIIGEYAAMARINLGGELNETHAKNRLYWTQYVTETMVKNGIVPFYWDNGYTGNNSSGLFERSTGKQAYPEIIKAIVDPKYNIISSSSNLISAQLKLYPNPAKTLINFESEEQNIGIGSLCNTSGQTISFFNVSKGSNIIYINHLTPGFYFFQLTTQSGIFKQKFLKQ